MLANLHHLGLQPTLALPPVVVELQHLTVAANVLSSTPSLAQPFALHQFALEQFVLESFPQNEQP